MMSGDVCGSGCERVGMNMAVSGVNMAAHAEVRDEESDAKCDLNACRRGKQRGSATPSVRRAIAAKVRAGMRVAANGDDE